MARRRRDRIHIGALLATVWGLASAACAPAPREAPNLLLILVDDLGGGDLGASAQGPTVTPHMDRLAAEGARFTRHYAEASCAPARAALLTGRNPAGLGFRPQGRGIPAEVKTLAELLRERGYTTTHLGKWHLGGTGIYGLDASPASALPSAQGFDHWFGFLDPLLLAGPATSATEDLALPGYRLGRYLYPWLLGSEAPLRQYDAHLTDLLTDRAVDFIRDAGAPWYLNLWYLAPHQPIQPHPRFAARHPGTPLGLHRALVEQLDDGIGRVLDALAESGQAERTLVVLLSDNGSATRSNPDSNAPLRGRKTEYNEGGTRTPLLIRWPAHVAAGTVVDAPVSILDVFPTVAALTGDAVADVDGRDLTPLLEGRTLPPRPLFWEQAIPGGGLLSSVLSADGRFRLTRAGEPVLLDLEADPDGGTDVLAQHAEEVRRLDDLYRRWRRDVLRVPVRVRPVGERGHARLDGNDLQRAPGWGGFTFGVGVTPDPREPRPEGDEVVAYQQDLWELTRNPRDALRLRVGGLELKGRKLRIGACNAVVVTGHFTVATIHPGNSGTNLALYLDGRLQDAVEGAPLPPMGDLAAPTLLGLAADGRDAFRGRLGRPVFLGTRVVETSDGAEIAAAEISDTLCPPGAAAEPRAASGDPTPAERRAGASRPAGPGA